MAVSSLNCFHLIRPLISCPVQIHRLSPPPRSRRLRPLTAQSQPTQEPNRTHENGIPIEYVKTLAKFRSRYNYIRVLEVSRKADHPFRGSRLLLLDEPGNIHSVFYLFSLLTHAYYDVFATLPPILPPGPVAILGFGAGSAARLILQLYPDAVVRGWELDPSVVAVGREFFGVASLERKYPERLSINVGDALEAREKNGFAGILVDLFSKGCMIPELQEEETWEKMKKSLRRGGRIMVNVGGSCIEAEDSKMDGDVIMENCLKAMSRVFGKKLFVFNIGNRGDDSSIALTGELPDLEAWRDELPTSLKNYVDVWRPYASWEYKRSPNKNGRSNSGR